MLGALAFVLFVLVPDRGWDGLDEADQDEDRGAPVVRGGTDRRAHGGRPLRRAEARRSASSSTRTGSPRSAAGTPILTPDICYRLYRLKYKDDEGAFSQTARAIAVLAHEAWHLHGETDEGITNCYAFQSGVALGRRLGLSEGTAARMMRQQLADNATYAASAPEYLVPRECRNGGSLDLAPDNDRFP